MIYDARQKAGLTQKQLAELIGTKQQVIARLEDADYEGHSLSMLQRIASGLGRHEIKDENEPPSVIAKDDYTLEIEFVNGEVGVYNCAPLLDFGVFQEFRNLNYFKQARMEGGPVVWPHEQDICPDTLYKNSQKLVGRSRA
jgi:transcriptional regulator with XRE-family HTH domain